jgi:pyridoxamine 5'-phosphate oxidase
VGINHTLCSGNDLCNGKIPWVGRSKITMPNKTLHLASLRSEYQLTELDEATVGDDPFVFFHQWFTEAVKAEIKDVNAMTLATVDSRFQPHARIVLLKGLETNGFVFYTNYESNKGKEIDLHPHVALLFYWHELERQVRIEGSIEKVPGEISDTYFHSRPEGSRIGAWASPQSRQIDRRHEIDLNYKKYAEEFSKIQIPRPPHWGGYIVFPHEIEFWQGRTSRLHDRILFTQTMNGGWNKCRLAP